MCPAPAHGLRHWPHTYAKYEAGELNIRASVLIALKQIYDCTYDDFFLGLDVVQEKTAL